MPLATDLERMTAETPSAASNLAPALQIDVSNNEEQKDLGYEAEAQPSPSGSLSRRSTLKVGKVAERDQEAQVDEGEPDNGDGFSDQEVQLDTNGDEAGVS